MKISNLQDYQREMYYNYKYQFGEDKAKEYFKGIKNAVNSLMGLSELFYSLAIQGQMINIAATSLGESFGKSTKKEIDLLRRRGIIVVVIMDKGSETTYHKKSELKNLNLFLKKNNKWSLEKENYFGVKTGRYILTRIYRKYYKEVKEERCPECGSSFN